MVTYWCMTAVGLLSSWIISHNFAQIDQSLFVNNTFTFASVYANGMLGAYVYASMESKSKRSRGEARPCLLPVYGSIKFCVPTDRTMDRGWNRSGRLITGIYYPWYFCCL